MTAGSAASINCSSGCAAFLLFFFPILKHSLLQLAHDQFRVHDVEGRAQTGK